MHPTVCDGPALELKYLGPIKIEKILHLFQTHARFDYFIRHAAHTLTILDKMQSDMSSEERRRQCNTCGCMGPERDDLQTIYLDVLPARAQCIKFYGRA